VPGEILVLAHFHLIAEWQKICALKVIWKYDLQEICLLPILKVISKGIDIKSFAGQVIAVDVFHLIHKATIFGESQLGGMCTLNPYD